MTRSHRLVGVVALAAVSVCTGTARAHGVDTGGAVGFGPVVLAGHATAETVAIGGLFGVESRRRGAAAVGVVQTAVLAGATAGVLAVAGLPPAVSDGTVAAVGGVLVGLGVAETAGTPSRDSD